MPRRMFKADADGRRYRQPSMLARVFADISAARPAWRDYQHAYVAVALGARFWELRDQELGPALDRLLAAWKPTTAEKVVASRNAARWKKNPYLADERELLHRQEMVKPALLAAERWVRDVTGIGDEARKAKDFSAALDSRKLLVQHVPTEGLLSGKDVAGKAPEPLIGQVNFAVVLGNPEARRALEAVVRVLEGESSGNGGQVVAGTVAQS